MNRIFSAAYAEPIAEAFALIPARLAARLGRVHFLTDTDPIWAGLHTFAITNDGRSYRETAHCCYPFHTVDGSTTVVIPKPVEPWVIVHELGHALDETLGFQHTARPCTAYAAANRFEAFGEAFTAFVLGDRYAHVAEPDRALLANL